MTDRRGVVSIEAAIVLALVVLPTVLGLFDLGSALTTRLRVDRALQAGLFAAWGISGASTSQLAQAAVAGAGNSNGGPAVSATASLACICLSPTGTETQGAAASCTGTCGSGLVLGQWATLTTTAAVTLPFPLPGVASPMILTATGTARVQ